MVREGPTYEVDATGGPIDIRLPETPSTGYRWEIREDSGQVARVLDSRYEDAPTEWKQPGSGGVHTFRVELLRPPPCEIHFILKRLWEAEPIEHSVVAVRPARERP